MISEVRDEDEDEDEDDDDDEISAEEAAEFETVEDVVHPSCCQT